MMKSMLERRFHVLLAILFVLSCQIVRVVASRSRKTGNLPWFHDAYSYWDFDEVVNNTVLDLQLKRTASIVGQYNIVPGVRDYALELSQRSSKSSSYVTLGDFTHTCLPSPQECHGGFTVSFWVNLKRVLHDGVLLQLGLSRKRQGITITTRLKDGDIFVVFYVNTPGIIRRVRAEMSSNVWHLVTIVWNPKVERTLSVFVNCSVVRSPEERVSKTDSRKGRDRKLVLGANHSGKKPTPVAVDDLAIWFKSLGRERICRIMNEERVNGNYSVWSPFSSCSSSCGSGTRTRTRLCNNPPPDYGGRDCCALGPGVHIVQCNLEPCPVHGNFTEWSSFSECTSTCGNSTKRRTRSCTNPAPLHGGRNCSILGPDVHIAACNLEPCPVQGNFSEWSSFSECTSTCGNSTKRRTRSCTNPAPLHGGRNCSILGPDVHIAACNLAPCPVHGNFSEWSSFSKCTSTCGNSSKRRTRNCTNPAPLHGGRNCSSLGPDVHIAACNLAPCPVHGNFSEWSSFSKCTSTCGNSTRKRNRSCNNPSPVHGGNDCSTLGPDIEIVQCDVSPCPVDGNFSQWSPFTACSMNCNKGLRTRKRTCTNPSPRFGGKDCRMLGPSTETRSCFVRPCPIHGNFTQWSVFGSCSRSCGLGTKIRSRSCTNPRPQFGGSDCSSLGNSTHTISCNFRPCAVHGNYSEWSAYGPCSKTCENGTQSRRRYCDSPSPSYGGRNCSLIGPAAETRQCETQPCPVPVGYPLNFTAFNRSSTSLGLRWSPVSQLLSNGVILEYAVLYGHLPPGIGEVGIIHKTVFINTTAGSLTQLKKYSWYSIRIAGKNRRGLGIASPPVVVLTDEDVPNSSPNLTPFGYNTSSTSLRVNWRAIADTDVNGILRGYQVFYKALGNEVTRNQTVGPNTFSLSLTELLKHRPYVIQVAGLTSKGTGGKSNKTVIQTDEDVPDASPEFHSCLNESSTSILLQWHQIPMGKRNGVIRGYKIYYRQTDLLGRPWRQINNVGANQTSQRISELHMFTNYSFRISAFTSKGEGVVGGNITVSTDEDVPCAPPSEVSAVAVNSTTLLIDWQPLSSFCTRGILRGYAVFYKRKSKPRDKFRSIIVPPTNFVMNITELLKFTSYDVSVAGYTSKGLGPRSVAIRVRTAEDVPNRYPVRLQGFNTSSTSIKLTWQPVPRPFIHGILRGYHVHLRKANETRLERTFTLSASETTFRVWNLLKYTKYAVRIVGFTTPGSGVMSPEVTVSTDEDAPSRVPEKFKATNRSAPTSIPLTWKPINDPFYVHGILLGYKIVYKLIRLAGETLPYSTNTTTLIVGPKVLKYALTHLDIYGTYRIRICAFTRIGDGPFAEIQAETCRCRSSYNTNWWINPPYIYKNFSEISGIFPAILPRMVSTCCGFCHEHVTTTTRFENDPDSYSSFLKPGVSSVRDNIDDTTELHFPMYGQIHQVKYYKRYEFIPLVQSPGVVFLVLEDDTHLASKMLFQTLRNTLPIFLLILVLSWIFAIIVWFADNLANPSQFPPSFFSGVCQGLWWSIITMTALGYGDRFPRSVAARVVGVVWILISSIIMALYSSIVTSHLTCEVVATDLKLYGAKVAVIHNSSEYRLAIRKNAKVDLAQTFNNLDDIYEALIQRQVQGALVDAYVLGSRKELFEKMGIRISKIYDYSSAFGVVLAGEAKKLQRCFRDHVKENRQQIFETIEENVRIIKKDDISQSVKRSKSLLDPTFIVYKQYLFINLILLFFAFTLGVVFEFVRKPLISWFYRSKVTYETGHSSQARRRKSSKEVSPCE